MTLNNIPSKSVFYYFTNEKRRFHLETTFKLVWVSRIEKINCWRIKSSLTNSILNNIKKIDKNCGQFDQLYSITFWIHKSSRSQDVDRMLCIICVIIYLGHILGLYTSLFRVSKCIIKCNKLIRSPENKQYIMSNRWS